MLVTVDIVDTNSEGKKKGIENNEKVKVNYFEMVRSKVQK